MAELIRQKTLREGISFTGTGLHSGSPATVRVLPASPDTGYRFARVDLPGAPVVNAATGNVVDTSLATSLGGDGFSIGTVEHLISALAGCGVDNALIEVDGDEVPIMDGSAEPFVARILRVGTVRQSLPKKMIRILDRIEVGTALGSASLEPSREFIIHFDIDFEHPAIGRQSMEYRYTPENFRDEIAFARTFGFLHQVEAMRKRGLALGGSLENAVVVGNEGVMNPEGLRSPDEFVRHKVLDTVGDLSLLGIPILGTYRGHRAGHALNHMLLQEVMERSERWDLVQLEEVSPRQLAFLPMEPEYIGFSYLSVSR